MRLRTALLTLSLVVACDDGSDATNTGVATDGTGATASPPTADGNSGGSTPTSTSAPTTSAADADATATDEPNDTGTGPDTSGTNGTNDTSVGNAGPTVLYEGPVAGGTVPGWNPDDPRALIMLGRLANTWVVTLARIDADGNLSDNTAQTLTVWGWDDEPPVLYDGPVVGGAIPGWSSNEPIPVVMAGYLEADGTWATTLASIGADGSLGDNLADRIIVWGWSGGTPGAPSVRYSGPIAGGQLDGWDPDAPEPMAMLARFSGQDTWQSTLVSIGPMGELRGNIADELMAWGW